MSGLGGGFVRLRQADPLQLFRRGVVGFGDFGQRESIAHAPSAPTSDSPRNRHSASDTSGPSGEALGRIRATRQISTDGTTPGVVRPRTPSPACASEDLPAPLGPTTTKKSRTAPAALHPSSASDRSRNVPRANRRTPVHAGCRKRRGRGTASPSSQSATPPVDPRGSCPASHLAQQGFHLHFVNSRLVVRNS